MTNEDLRDQLPALALNALSADEERETLAQLRTQPGLRAEWTDLTETAALLSGAFRQIDPPPHLWTRIVRAAGPVAAAVVTLPRRAVIGAASAAAATILVLGGLTYTTQQGIVQARQQLRTSDQALGLVARPNARFVLLSGRGKGYVRLVHDTTIRKGALIVADLRDPGRERVYQVWLRAGEDRHSPGVFRPERGQTMVMPIEADFHRFQVISITIETGPRGVDKSTHPPVMAGRF